MNVIEKPKFELRFLLPNYWLTWLGAGFLYLISWLPYRWQLALGRAVGRLFYRLVPKRAAIARRNLELCFPDKSADAVEALVKTNMENTGIAFFETGMAWWWPNWRIQRKLHVHGVEHLQAPLQQGQGVLMLLFHFLAMLFECLYFFGLLLHFLFLHLLLSLFLLSLSSLIPFH